MTKLGKVKQTRWKLYLLIAAIACGALVLGPGVLHSAALDKPAPGGELRMSLYADVKTLDPWLSDDTPSDTVRYLTEGVLIRINRRTQQPEAELATSWKVSKDGRKIEFQLRKGVQFPDGSPFAARDVISTFDHLLDPSLHAPVADSFKFDQGVVKVTAQGDYTVTAAFPVPVPGSERLFDLVAVVSAKSSSRPAPGLGAFLIQERKPGTSILLRRNPSYWKHDANGHALPYFDSVRLDIQQNRDLELLKFRRGEVSVIDVLSPDLFERLSKEAPGSVIDSGPTFDSDFMWFNQTAKSPVPANKKEWFRSEVFRRAVSGAINRADIARLVYKGHASPALGPVSPANKLWFNANIKPEVIDTSLTLKQLIQSGFTLQSGSLKDHTGAPVEFSIITNAGNKSRELMATLIQQDLAKLGIKINVVTLDFPSLIERITRSFDYEACLLGFTNVEADPNGVMNIYLSSASNHAWNPGQKAPETPWEHEVDKLMLAQAATPDYHARKKNFDRVQEIIRQQAPIVFLVHPNALSAVAPSLAGVSPSASYPHTFWNAENLFFTKKSGQ